MIKVLHVVGKRPRGGVGTFLINMNRQINTDIIKFDYLICDPSKEDGAFDKAVKAFGAQVFVLPELKYRNTLKFLSELGRFYKSNHDYDIVHVHSPNIGLFNFYLAKKYGIMNRLLHSHNTKYSDKSISAIRNFILQLPLKFYVTSKVACSKKASKFLFGSKAMEKGEVFLAKNAIDADKFRYNKKIREQVRKKLNLEGNFVIGHIGRFNAQKNHSFLLDIFQQIVKKDKSAILVLVGNGELEGEILKKSKSFGIEDSIVFMGSRNDVSDLLQAFDVFVLPSLFEGLPLVGIEIQAAGLPSVVSNSITDEIKITDIVEFMSLQDSPIKWAEKIISFKNYSRTNLFEEVFKSGYDEKIAAKKLQDHYYNLTNRKINNS
jgi:glycosyltransferase involved in cell wall biosynthesis